jgi:hypothetical protein
VSTHNRIKFLRLAAGSYREVACRLLVTYRLVRKLVWSVEKLAAVVAENLLGLPAITMLGAFIRKEHRLLEIVHGDGVPGHIQQGRFLTELRVDLQQFRGPKA